jgi:hypothetical protein
LYQYIDTHPNESYIRISVLKLDTSQNGRMDGIVSTRNEKLGKIYNDAVRKISTSLSDYKDGASSLCENLASNQGSRQQPVGNDNPDDEKEDISHVCSKKRKLSETSSIEPSESSSTSKKGKNSRVVM